jgi:hypothetical protein
MATRAQARSWLDSTGPNQLRQREPKQGRAAEHRARPLEFDESGFPIPQPVPGFAQRVRRLINGS